MIGWEALLELLGDFHAVRLVREEPDLADFDGMGLEELIDLTSKMQSLASSAQELRRKCEGMVAAELGEGRSVRVGEEVWRYTASWDERCFDPEGFAAWLASQDAATVGKVVNPNTARKSPLGAARDTFFERIPGESKLTRVPLDRAPKFLSDLAEGEVR